MEKSISRIFRSSRLLDEIITMLFANDLASSESEGRNGDRTGQQGNMA